jgi:hypothetical protein
MAAILAVAVPVVAGAQTPRAPFATLVDQVRAHFPIVAGVVIETQGAEATLSFGRGDGVQPGLQLSIVREGRELRHPKTGEVLGRAEQPVGRVTVTQVFEQYSVGRMSDGATAQAGDLVRVSSGKIRLTVLALASGVRDNQVEAAVQELTGELDQTGRFQVIMGDALGVRLGQAGVTPEEALEGKGLQAAARDLRVENLMVLLFKRVQNRPFVEVRLFAQPIDAPVLTTALFVPSSVKAQAVAQFSGNPSTAPERRAAPPSGIRSLLARLLGGELQAGTYSSGEASIPLKEVARFPFPVLAMDLAVSPRDHVPRVVVTDGQKIYLYRLANQVLEPEWTYSAWTIGSVFSAQLADLDGDGVFEVVANRYHPQTGVGLTSFVLTTRNGKPEPVAKDLGDILLAVDTKGTGVKDTLWRQRFTVDGFFMKGDAERWELRNGSLVSAGRVRVPSDFRATGATMSNILGKDAPRALAYIDPRNRLAVAVENEDRWRSSSQVGSSSQVKLEITRMLDRAGRSDFYATEPMPLSVDLDADGIEEVVVPMGPAGWLAVVFRGPAGFRLQSVNSGFEGSITALGAFKPEDQTTPNLVAAVVRLTGFVVKTGETQIIMTIPPQ